MDEGNFSMVDLKTFQKLPFLMTVVVCSGWKNNSYQRSFSSMQCLRYILTAKSFFCLDHENRSIPCLNLSKLNLEAVRNDVIDRLIMFFYCSFLPCVSLCDNVP